MFPRVEYLRWIEGRPDAADHDLGTTDQRAGEGPLLDRLAQLPEPPAGNTCRDLLARELAVSPSELLVTAGASHANFLAVAAALDGAGDDVLVESPGYAPLAATPRGLGASVRRFDRSAATGFALDADRAAAALTAETALVVVSDRHNPSGYRADRAALQETATAAAADDARVLVDEVYAPLTTGPIDRPGFGGGTAAGTAGTVVTGSLTKCFGLGDLRIGWLAADEAFVARARAVADHVPTASGLSERLAARVVADRDAQVRATRDRATANADRLTAFVANRADLSGAVHEGCPVAFLAHRRADGDTVADAAWSAGVLVVPGRFFGDAGRFRVAAGRAPDATARALDAFGAVLDGL